jgi:hypothetical protein
MHTKISNRIIIIGRAVRNKKMIPSRQLVSSTPAASQRIVIIKDGEFIRSRLGR